MRTEAEIKEEIAKLAKMKTGTSWESRAELDCAISALQWALGKQKKPESFLYGK